MSESRWRMRARAAVAEALKQAPAGLDGPALRKHISTFYPFGERRFHPYKVWLSEVSKVLRGATDNPLLIRCRACGARRGRPCKGKDEFALVVAADAEHEGRLDDAKQIRLQAFHEMRCVDAGFVPSNETLPLFAIAGMES